MSIVIKSPSSDLKWVNLLKYHFGNKQVKLDYFYSFELNFQREFKQIKIRTTAEADLKTNYAIKQSILAVNIKDNLYLLYLKNNT